MASIYLVYLCKSLLVLSEDDKRLGIGIRENPQHTAPEYLKELPSPNHLSDAGFAFLAGWLCSFQLLEMLAIKKKKLPPPATYYISVHGYCYGE